jgi:hypothetical protein
MVEGGVVHHEVDDDAHPERLRVVHALDEIAGGAVLGVDPVEVGDVVAVVPVRRRIERLEPDAGDAEAMQVVQAPAQPLEVPDAVAAGVHVLLDVEAVEDGVLVPEVLNGHGISLSNDRSREIRRRLQGVAGFSSTT